MRRLSVMVRTIPTSKINKNAYNGCFLHQNSESEFLICAKQTADSLLLLVQKSLRSLHFLVSKNLPHKSVTLTPSCLACIRLVRSNERRLMGELGGPGGLGVLG